MSNSRADTCSRQRGATGTACLNSPCSATRAWRPPPWSGPSSSSSPTSSARPDAWRYRPEAVPSGTSLASSPESGGRSRSRRGSNTCSGMAAGRGRATRTKMASSSAWTSRPSTPCMPTTSTRRRAATASTRPGRSSATTSPRASCDRRAPVSVTGSFSRLCIIRRNRSTARRSHTSFGSREIPFCGLIGTMRG